MDKILDLKMTPNDAEAKTVRDYLKALLLAVWEQDESFSGKRPFGNSGWKYEIYATLVKHKVVAGKMDGDLVDEVAEGEADEIIIKAIKALS